MNNTSLAVIPARGGSKRIPRKNIRNFLGKPILAYSIEAAHAAGCFDEVIVSTDDAEIAAIAKKFGATVPFLREPYLADDFTGTNAVVADVLKRVKPKYELACCIYATAPLVSSSSIVRGKKLLQAHPQNEFAVTVTDYEFPIERAVFVDDHGFLDMKQPEHRMTRSQDLPRSYHDAGQIYWGTRDAFINGTSLFSGNTLPIHLPHYLVQDIDTEDDWLRAEAIYRAMLIPPNSS